MPRTRSTLLAALLGTALLLGACGEDDAVDTSQEAGEDAGDDTAAGSLEGGDAGPEAIEVSGELGEKPTIDLNDAGAVDELFSEDLVEGDGDEVRPGDTVEVDYVGVQLDGTEFDASYDREPVSFPLDQVIAGWTEGIPGMKVGGRRLLVVPSDLAYGPNAEASGRPAGTLVFVVDLVSIPTRAPEPVDPEGDGSGVIGVTGAFGEAPVVALNGVEPATELVTTDVIVGTGDPVLADSSVSVQLLSLLLDGTDAGSTWSSGGQPSTITVATLPEAIRQGLVGMTEGGRRLLVVPAALAQPPGTTPPSVPGDTLVFVIDVVEVIA